VNSRAYRFLSKTWCGVFCKIHLFKKVKKTPPKILQNERYDKKTLSIIYIKKNLVAGRASSSFFYFLLLPVLPTLP
jgi:hypothetical protein